MIKQILNYKVSLSTIMLLTFLTGCSLVAKWCSKEDGETAVRISKEVGWINKETGCWNWTDKAPICPNSVWYERVPGLHPGAAIDLKVLGDKYNTNKMIDSMSVLTGDDKAIAKHYTNRVIDNLSIVYEKIFYDVTDAELEELTK